MNWRFWRRKVERYVLMRRKEDGRGFEKVMDISSELADFDMFTQSEIFSSLTKGIYSLVSYREGRSGFKTVWGPAAFGGSQEEAEEMVRPREPREIDVAAQIERALAPLEKFKKVAEVYDKYFGRQAMVESIKTMRTEYDALGNIFGTGSKVSGEEAVVYEGKLPIWMHPKAVVGTIDQALDTIEKRAKKWGIIEEEGGPPREELLKLPPRPTTGTAVSFKSEDMKEGKEDEHGSD